MAIIRANIRMNTSLPFKTYEQDGWKTARCDLLKVSGIGKTRRSAVKNLKDSIALLIQGAMEDNTLDSILKECGFRQQNLAGVPVWEILSSYAKKYSEQEQLEFTTTLKPLIKIPNSAVPPGDYKSVDPVVITAQSSQSSASGLSA